MPFEGVPPASAIMFKLREQGDSYPCSRDKHEWYKDDPREWMEYWKSITEEIASFVITNGEVVDDWSVLNSIQSQLMDRLNEMEYSKMYSLTPQNIEYNEVSPEIRLYMELERMVADEKQAKKLNEQRKKNKINIAQLIGRHDKYAQVMDAYRAERRASWQKN